MYRKILVPLDGSKRAEHILKHVEAIARLHGSKVLLLHVVHPPVLSDGFKSISLLETEREFEKILEDSQGYLAGIEGEFREKKISARKLTEWGPVVETILDVARREEVDLIAMASHGRGGLSRVFYGSVAAGILQSIDRPMLLVRSRNL